MADLTQMREKWYTKILVWDGSRESEKQFLRWTSTKVEAGMVATNQMGVGEDIKQRIKFVFPSFVDKSKKTCN